MDYVENVTEEIGADLTERLDSYLDKINAVEVYVQSNLEEGLNDDDFQEVMHRIFFNDPTLDNISIAPNAAQTHVYPIEKQIIIGHNLLEDDRQEVVLAVERAIESRNVVISGPYENRLDEGTNIIVLRNPVYYDDGSFYGLINIVVKTENLFLHRKQHSMRILFSTLSMKMIV